jgi:hypothetical protein
MLNVVMLSVVMLIVAVPLLAPSILFKFSGTKSKQVNGPLILDVYEPV